MLEFSDELASEGVMLVDKVIVSTLSNVVHQFSGTVEQVLNGMIVQGYSNFYISKCMDLSLERGFEALQCGRTV